MSIAVKRKKCEKTAGFGKNYEESFFFDGKKQAEQKEMGDYGDFCAPTVLSAYRRESVFYAYYVFSCNMCPERV